MRLLLLTGVVFLLLLFIWFLRNHLARDNKMDELREVELEGDLMDIDKKIARERVRQRDVSDEIEEIYSQSEVDKKEEKHD